MVENMLRVEESTAPVEDEDGHLITTGPQDFFTVLNQQVRRPTHVTLVFPIADSVSQKSLVFLSVQSLM